MPEKTETPQSPGLPPRRFAVDEVFAFPSHEYGELRDVRGHGSYLLTVVEVFGVDHHLYFIRVVRDDCGELAAWREGDQLDLDDVHALYDYPLATVRVPGYEGDFVACMHPYEA